MPKNDKKRKNAKNKRLNVCVKRELLHKDEMQEYAIIVKLSGDRRAQLKRPDETMILGRIIGSLRRCRMKVDDVVLISYREYQMDRCDIIHKYNNDEVRALIKEKELPNNFQDENVGEDGTEGVTFAEEEEDVFDFEDI